MKDNPVAVALSRLTSRLSNGETGDQVMQHWTFKGCHPVSFFDSEAGPVSVSVCGGKRVPFQNMDAAIAYAASEIKRKCEEEMKNLASRSSLPKSRARATTG